MEPKRPPAYKAAFLAAIPLVVILGIGFGEGSAFLGVIERRIARGPEAYEIFHNRETVEGTVTCYAEGGHKWLWINGMGQTFLCTETKLMAHLPVLLASDPRDILIICFGMGTTLKSACVHEGLSITAVDLVPELFKCFGYYHTKAEGILERENVKVVGEDGRTFLLYSGDTYDVITVDPSPPIHSAGTVNLYTREFFTLCREHLAPGGVACLWFPYGADDLEISEEDLAYILSTFRSVFPHMTVWRGPHGWGYYLIGTLRKQEIDRERLKAAFAERDIVDDLGEFDTSCVSYDQLIQLLVIDERNIGNVTSDAMIITDDYPYTEFPLWRNVRASFRRYLHRMAQRRSNR
jgi:spermidine synthase